MSLLDDIDIESDNNLNLDYDLDYDYDLGIINYNLGKIENYYQEIKSENINNYYKVYSAFIFLVISVYYFHLYNFKIKYDKFTNNNNIKLILYK